MCTARLRLLLVLLAGGFAAVLGASPAVADVDCADLRTRDAAQSYYDGRVGDADRLDGDSDGQACEASTDGDPGRWTLLGLTGLGAAAVLGGRLVDRRRGRAGDRESVTLPPSSLPLAAPGSTQRALGSARTGTLVELAHALRLVPYAERMPLLEDHATAHALAPQEVLDALVAEVDDLAVQRWALAGYDPPSSVRLMRCSCVGGLRNFKRRGSPDGFHTWSCATCQSSVRPSL